MTNMTGKPRPSDRVRVPSVEFEPPSAEFSADSPEIDVGNFYSSQKFARGLRREQVVLMRNDNSTSDIDIVSG